MPEREWTVCVLDSAAQERLSRALGISSLLAQLLINRGLRDPEEARVFLYGGPEDLQDSFALPGMEQAVAVLAEVVARREKILVYGDYDVDGLSGTALLCSFFAALGLEPGYYIPDRLTEGYGLHRDALEQALAAGYQAVVTVDCGLAAGEEVAWARQQGLKVVITDHHHLPPALPPAEAVVTPAAGRHLAGVGVAFHLARALNRRLGNPFDVLSLLDLVALGTIADVVPLLGDNRLFVREGLKQLAAGRRPGLRALAEVSGVSGRDLDPRLVAFSFVPRLNAPGRLGDARPAFRLLLTDSIQEAWELARELDRLNQERQAIENQILAHARELIAREVDPAAPIIILASPLWHSGVVGIVAGRLVDEYRRPVVLLAVEGEEARGSGRSVPGVPLYDLLAACRDLLSRFGGHDLAAGLSLPVENLTALRERLTFLARDYLSANSLAEPPLCLDAAVFLSQVNEKLVEEIGKLEPYGEGNKPPLFALWGARVVEARAVGRNGEHLRLVVAAQGEKRAAVGFGFGPVAEQIAGRCVDLAFTPVLDTYDGSKRVELRLADVRLTPAVARLPLVVCRQTPEMPAPGSCLWLAGEDFFPFWASLGAQVPADKGNFVVAVPSASLAGYFTLWFRELGLTAARLGSALRRQEVEALAKRLRAARGVVLVSTAGFLEQHAPLLIPVASGILLRSPERDSAAPSGGLLPFPLEVGLRLGNFREQAACRVDFDGLKVLVGEGRRLVVYVRRPEQAEALFRRLRREVPEREMRVGLYHQALPAPAKEMAAKAWARGDWYVLVGTPAAAILGGLTEEKEVVLCYPPYSFTEYYLLALGASAVYCCWPQAEEAVNERYLRSLWPPPTLLKLLSKPGNGQPVTSLPQRAVRLALAVLEELAYGKKAPTSSWRYREAKLAWGAWRGFHAFANGLPFRRGGI